MAEALPNKLHANAPHYTPTLSYPGQWNVPFVPTGIYLALLHV